MRISNEELRRIAVSSDLLSEKRGDQRATSGTFPAGESVVSALESRDMKMLSETLAQVPETREQIVASLKERIESGTYHVSGEQIAEMMVRRALADRMR